MNCPHCQRDSFSFPTLYLWPFGRKTCPDCGEQAVIKKDWRLALASAGLGVVACIPAIITLKLWPILPGAVIALLADYWLDRRFRVLIKADS